MLLPNGKVLIVGGGQTTTPGFGECLSSAELYDPASGTFSIVSDMANARCEPRAVLLDNGKVLILGWLSASAELFDPATCTFSTTGSMNTPHRLATATLISNGQVLVAGGSDGTVTTSTTELYDRAIGAFGATASMAEARQAHTATLFPDGQVLVTGGFDGSTNVSSAEVFSFAPTPTPVPGLTGWGLAVISGALAILLVWHLKKGHAGSYER